ncbi:MAG: hypothetical protein JXL97_19925 [Bacteroidales bacterium]|nr:hypothetical protein [Bacteroidales bacterium]
MNIDNKLNNFGDSNISLQNITANDITIFSGQEINSEIKEAKSKIAEYIANLIQIVGLRANPTETENATIINNENFDDIDFDDLLKSIEFGNCVLFVGPEISVDENGNSLHHQFYQKISNPKRKYNEQEGFFMPGSETRLINASKDYYSTQFLKENTIANNVLKKLAQIPFELIVSLTPDDTMHQIYLKYNIKHHFLYYTGTKHENLHFENKVPILYNALGSACENGRFIYTHKQFNEYLKNDIAAKFPFEIETEIKKEDTTHYLFIGFDFNKWHNKLIMYELNLLPEVESFTFDANKTEPINQEFIKQQFNITFIDANYTEFTELILQKSKIAGLTKSLNNSFLESILNELEIVRVKVVDCNKLEQLKEFEKDLSSINEKINRS